MKTNENNMTKEPAYRFSGYTDAWEQRKLGEVANYITKGTTPKDKSGKGPIRFVKVENLTNGHIETTSFISEEEHQGYLKRSILEENDILFSIAGTLGRVASVEKELLPANTNQALSIIRGYTTDKNYLLTILGSKAVEDFIRKNPTVGAQPNLSLQQVGDILISLPTLAEQTAIGNFFQTLDRSIALHQRKLDSLKEQKKTYLQKLFPRNGETIPEIRFPEFENAPAWEQRKLGEVFEVITDYVANGSFESLRNNVATYEHEEFAYMVRLQDASNMWKGPWLYTDERGYEFLSKTKLYKNDILMSNVGSVGKFYLVPELSKPMTLAPNSVLIRSTVNDNSYLYYSMQTSIIQSQILMKKTPGVQDKINKTDFKKIITPIPTIAEQTAIGNFFQTLDRSIAQHQTKLDKLKESKQTLLKKMFI